MTNITNSSNIDLGTFQVPDKWNANEHRLHFNFSYVSFERGHRDGRIHAETPLPSVNVAASIYFSLYTGLPGKDESSETTQQNQFLAILRMFLIL